jgi:peptide/nickel transport system substrate-binding protein
LVAARVKAGAADPVDLTRRSLLCNAVAAAAVPSFMVPRRANCVTPAHITVIAKAIDDINSGFDPAEAYDDTNWEVGGNLYRTLLTFDSSGSTRLVGDLAEWWEVSRDGRILTFHLTGNARFESGRLLTAEDAAFSLQRVVKLDKEPAFLLTQFGWDARNVEGLIKADGPYRLVLTLPTVQATGVVFSCLSSYCGSIVDKAAVLAHEINGDLGNAWLRSHSAGAGSYRLIEWLASDRIILESNPNASVKPRVPRLIISHVADPAMQVFLLKKGDVDIARNLGSDQLKSIAGRDDFRLVHADSLNTLVLSANEAVPQFRQPQVLQALKWAVDYESIADNITPRLWNMWQSVLPKGTPGALADKPFRKDVARARDLMATAGHPHGFEVTLDHYAGWPYADIAQALQSDLAAIGIKVQLLAGEQSQVITKTRARRHQLALQLLVSDYLDPNSPAQWACADPDDSDATSLKTAGWRSHFADRKITAAVDAASRELDEATRVQMYAQIQRDFWERAPFVVLLQQQNVAVQRRGVSGFELGALNNYTRYAGITKS